MSHIFSEQETEKYYDEEDATYRAFWDSNGSLHWGYFDGSEDVDYLDACARLNQVMLARSGINEDSNVLDLGCGNGNTSIWLAQEAKCRVTGVDLSGVRVDNAIKLASQAASSARSRLTFQKASATDLPFEPGSFTHVWSQATVYHVPDKLKVLSEVRRVLAKGGTFILDDLIKPKQDVSAQAKKYVYDRLLFDTPFSFSSYQDGLKAQGFDITYAEDMSGYLATSYRKLRQLAITATEKGNGNFSTLIEAYPKMITAVEDGELGWALYACRKT